MIKAVIFGGTTEGRELCEFCAAKGVSAIYCVATEDGARPVEALPYVNTRIGRLDTVHMAALLGRCRPELVIDATHPYAWEASRNIEAACLKVNEPLLRVTRENTTVQGFVPFDSVDALVTWLEQKPGNVFVTTGVSLAGEFTKLTDYRNRVWLRILPSLDSLRACLDLGYTPERLICMQGPFSEDLNHAMLKAADAKFLVTKNSGAAGGFVEKVRAAQSLDIVTAVLSKPVEQSGVPMEDVLKRLAGLTR